MGSVREKAEAELAEIHRKYEAVRVAACQLIRDGEPAIERRAERLAEDYSDAARRLYERHVQPSRRAPGYTEWNIVEWRREVARLTDHVRVTIPKPEAELLGMLHIVWHRLKHGGDSVAAGAALDCEENARAIAAPYRKALRSWMLRWREQLRRHENLDSRFVDDLFAIDFFVFEPAGDQGDSIATTDPDDKEYVPRASRVLSPAEWEKESSRHAGSVFVPGAAGSANEAGDAAGAILSDVDTAAILNDQRRRRSDRTMPLDLIVKKDAAKVRAVVAGFTARQQDLLREYYVRHRHAAEIAGDFGVTEQAVWEMAERIADAFEGAGLPRPRHNRSKPHDQHEDKSAKEMDAKFWRFDAPENA